MTSKGVSLLKFVGTVSLGLLTGLSYSLTAVTVPSILSLPSASDAVRAFQNLYPSATARLRILTSVSATSFLFAFYLSPRAFRHPYLVYASVLCLTSGLAEQIAPYVFRSSPDSSLESSREALAARQQARREREEARMEASYEVLGDTQSTASDEDAAAAAAAVAAAEEREEQEALNGEEVRRKVEGFRKTQLVQTGIASVGFLMSVIGIWGDRAIHVF